MRNARATAGLTRTAIVMGLWILTGSSWALASVGGVATPAAAFKSRADAPPRKVVIASAQLHFSGSVEERLSIARRGLEDAARNAGAKGKQLDLVVFPEFALQREGGRSAEEQAVRIDDPAVVRFRQLVREHRAWVVLPMTLREGETELRCSNAAVLFDRAGEVAGIFRKVNPMLDGDGRFEGGVTPGDAYPVFDCDFGRLGILICWDMSYEEAWAELAVAGAEIVALPSASPQTLRPAAEALRHRYHVVTSTQRDNASLFDPIGRTVAQVTEPGMLVHEIDLSYAILHWAETLQEGRALTDRYGERVGGVYSSREDTGIFWSNDPKLTIGEMIRELGLREMPEVVEAVRAARVQAK